LKQKYNTNYALLLEIPSFGVCRSYKGFIPLSAPIGFTNVKLHLVDLNTNKVIGEGHFLAEERSIVDWDEPPHFLSLMKCLDTALKNALNKAYNFITLQHGELKTLK